MPYLLICAKMVKETSSNRLESLYVVSGGRWFWNGRNGLKTKIPFFPVYVCVLDFKNYAKNAISMMCNLKGMREIPKMDYKQNKMDQTRFQMNSLTTV